VFAVIQELPLKRADAYGAHKEMVVDTNPFNRRGFPQYGYFETGERFERPIKKAYKISIHESKRINGVVTKKQFVVTTVNYYAFATDWFLLGEYTDKINSIAEQLNVNAADIYDILDKKITPLQQSIRAEFIKTEEYRVTEERKTIIDEYKKQKAAFAEKYGCPEAEYDFCFTVFGNLMNESHLKKITGIIDV